MTMRCGPCEAPDYCACADFFGGELEFFQTTLIAEAIAAAGPFAAPVPSPGAASAPPLPSPPGSGGAFLEVNP